MFRPWVVCSAIIYGLLKQLVAWLKYKGFFSRLFCDIPLFAAVPVPSFEYPVPPLELPSLLPVSPPPVIHNKHTLVSHKKKSVTISFCQWHTQRGKGLSTHLGNASNTHWIIHKYILGIQVICGQLSNNCYTNWTPESLLNTMTLYLI